MEEVGKNFLKKMSETYHMSLRSVLSLDHKFSVLSSIFLYLKFMVSYHSTCAVN
jgi:hypothetical protein